MFAPNHKLRSAVTALAIGNVGKPRDAATGGHAVGGHAADGDANGHGCDSCDKRPSHDTSRIAWAKLMARVGEEFPFACPWVWWRHPTHRVHYRSGADPEDPHASGRTARASASLSRPWPADRLGRARAGPLSTGQSFSRRPTSCPTSISTASNGIPCHGADGPQAERFQGGLEPTRKIRH